MARAEPILRLAGLDIKVLSGPISMYYLKPTIPGTPLVLLFGDQHGSLQNMAKCEEEEGCYTIYSDTLLLGLDELAKRYPIDFYLEYDRRSQIQNNEVLFGKLKYKIYGCTETRERIGHKYEDICPTRNIRYHKTDVRFFENSIEGEMTNLYISYFRDVNFNTTVEIFPNNFISEILSKVFYIINRGLPYDQVREEIADTLLEITTHKNSLCGKQIRKVPFDIKWANIFISQDDYITNLENYKKAYIEFPSDTAEVLSAMLNGIKIYLNPLKKYIVTLVSSILLYIHSWFVDLYMVARMLKPPAKNTPSYLSLGMFGDVHTKNICEFLKTTVGYELEYSHKSIEGSLLRQIYILQDIDIDRDIQELNGGDVSLYLKKIASEKATRAITRKSEDVYPFSEIDSNAKRLYGIRLFFYIVKVVDKEMIDFPLREMIKVLYSRNIIEDEALDYIYDCAQELLFFIVMDVCKEYINPGRLISIILACIIASSKYYMLDDAFIYKSLEGIYYEATADRYLINDMVDDIERRTDYQLCRKTYEKARGVIQPIDEELLEKSKSLRRIAFERL